MAIAKDNKQLIFGIHGVTICDFFSHIPVGEELDVIGDLTLNVSAEVESLFGGSKSWPVAGEPKTLAAEGSVELREFPEELAEYLVAGVGAKTAASATGGVTTLTNFKGSTAMSATIGIASVGLKSGETAELKAGIYVVVVTAAGTVDVYSCSTVDMKKGTDLTKAAGTMKIAEGLVIATATPVEVTDTGVELTGGSGTIGMTVGDTAIYEVYPPHNGVETITMGQSGAEFKRVALVLTAQKRTTGEICYIHCPNALCLGMPLGAKETAFQSGSVNIGVFTHSTLDYSVKLTNIKGTSV
jgi:hypothetical protein